MCTHPSAGEARTGVGGGICQSDVAGLVMLEGRVAEAFRDQPRLIAQLLRHLLGRRAGYVDASLREQCACQGD